MHGHGQPVHVAAAAPTLLGAPLEHGERVVFFRQHSYRKIKISLFIVGLLTVVMLIGILVIVAALRLERKNPRAHAITNRRLLAFPYAGPPLAHPLAAIADVEAERAKAAGRGIGGAIGAAIVAVQQGARDRKPKLEPGYWKHAVGVRLALRSGGGAVVMAPVGAPELGMALAGVLERGVDALPGTVYPA